MPHTYFCSLRSPPQLPVGVCSLADAQNLPARWQHGVHKDVPWPDPSTVPQLEAIADMAARNWAGWVSQQRMNWLGSAWRSRMQQIAIRYTASVTR